MMSVRLTHELEEEIERIASNENRTKSDIVKDALNLYIATKQSTKSSYEVGISLFGRYSSGIGNRSTTYKQRIKEKLREKHAR